MQGSRPFALLAAAAVAAYVGDTLADGLGMSAGYVATTGYVVAVALLVLAVAEIVTGRPAIGRDGTGIGWPLLGFAGITAVGVLGQEIAGGEHILWVNLVLVFMVAAALGVFALARNAADPGPAGTKSPADNVAVTAATRKRRRLRKRRQRSIATTPEPGDDAPSTDSD